MKYSSLAAELLFNLTNPHNLIGWRYAYDDNPKLRFTKARSGIGVYHRRHLDGPFLFNILEAE
jgi:hypothetical protein